MSKSYEITSIEGAEFAADPTGWVPEIGDKVKLELDKDQETALIAAGWLAEPEKKKEG